MLKQTEIMEIFNRSKAFLTGHFLLTSGLHSPNYFQCALVLEYPKYASLLGADLARRFRRDEVDVVVSPALGGIIVGHEVARELDIPALFAERENNEMTLRRGFTIQKGERVVIVEDVLTTGKSIREVISVVNKCEGKVIGIGVLVDRSAGKAKFEQPLESLVQIDVITYPPDNCPLCKQNIPLVKPGSRKLDKI